MKTVILAGIDNLTFSAADLIDPSRLKLIGFATTIEEAWNIYDKDGKVIENTATLPGLPVMPIDAAAAMEPDMLILAASADADEEALRYKVYSTGYRGEVISLYDIFSQLSLKTAALRRLAWRLDALGVPGAAADLGAYRGDISWQLNALMPHRRLYLFDTFTGYDARDIAREHELGRSDVRTGQYALSPRELENLNDRLLSRMPYSEMTEIRAGWFPETACELEDEKYALVYIDTGLYAPTYAGLQYFFPRMNKGGVILVAGYGSGKSDSVRRAVDDLEKKYGAFLITPVNDLDGSIMITHP